MTKIEKNWIAYDIGNSAFTLLVSTIFPLYFKSLTGEAGFSETEYLAYWGYAASAATLIVAFSAPILGGIADAGRYRKIFFTLALIIGAIGCAVLGTVQSWIWFLVVFIIAKTSYSSSLVFYDSMLPDVSQPERMDEVSSVGYGMGYIGSTIPFVVSLVFILFRKKLGITFAFAVNVVCVINAVWWIAFSIPLIKSYRQIHFVHSDGHPVRKSLSNLWQTFRNIRKEKSVFIFLLAFFFYIDGVYTIITMATAYGSAVGLDSTGLLLALLVTQFVAFPFSMLFAKLAGKYNTQKLIIICIVGYLCIALYAIQLNTQIEFWILAVCVGMFQGGIQALSRSYYASIIPPEKSGEYFGLYDICGKGASFLGTALMGFTAQLTGRSSAGVIAIAGMILIGLILFLRSVGIRKLRKNS